jgi:hypothetical protein
MSQAMCELLVDKLINSDELGEITETIQVGVESGHGIWQLLMDNPIIFGMLMGGGIATYIRKWFFKRYRNVPRSTQ